MGNALGWTVGLNQTVLAFSFHISSDSGQKRLTIPTNKDSKNMRHGSNLESCGSGGVSTHWDGLLPMGQPGLFYQYSVCSVLCTVSSAVHYRAFVCWGLSKISHQMGRTESQTPIQYHVHCTLDCSVVYSVQDTILHTLHIAQCTVHRTQYCTHCP